MPQPSTQCPNSSPKRRLNAFEVVAFLRDLRADPRQLRVMYRLALYKATVSN